jgi:AraC-like DNA-binding protein
VKKCVVSYNKYDKQSFTRVHIAVSVHILYKSKKEGSITEDLLQRSKERPSTSQRKSALLEQIEAYVDTHLTEKLTLRVISAQTGVSVSTVTQLFQKKVSTTFHDFVTQRRLEMAKKMIEEGMPLELNMLGMATDRYYPVPLFWRTVSEMGAAVIIGADAHSPGRVFSQNEVDAALGFADKYKLNLKQDIELRRII